MGSLFSGPSVNTRQSTAAQKAALGAAKKASANINAVSTASGNAISDFSNNLTPYFTPLNLNAGGITANYGPNGYTVGTDPTRQALVNQLSDNYANAAGFYQNLRNQWTPGESDLRNAQLAAIENARQANISDLRQNLEKRAVLGSSFAQDAQTRANLDFEQQKNQVISQTYLQELDAQNQLIGQQYTAGANAVSTKINELNLEGNVGAQLTSQAQDALKAAADLRGQLLTNAGQLKVTGASNAGQILSNSYNNIANLATQQGISQAQLDAQAQAGAGSLFGTLATAPLTGGSSLLGYGATKLFG